MAGPERPHKKKPRKASKAKRNFRIGGDNRGPSPNLAASTKYVRSGGPARCAARKARNHGCGNPGEHVKRDRPKPSSTEDVKTKKGQKADRERG